METSFTGVLVRKDYKPGQDYVQLIFKGANDTKLSISRNVQLMKTLTVGGTYRLIGREYTHGSKTYIRDPKAIPVAAPKKSHKKLILATVVVFACFALGIALAAATNLRHASVVKVSPTTTQNTVSTNTAPAASSVMTTDTTDTADTSSTTTTTTPHTTTTPKPTTPTATAPVTAAPAATVDPSPTPDPAPVPVPDPATPTPDPTPPAPDPVVTP